MSRTPVLIDQHGNPINTAALRQERATPTLGGVRSVLTGYPGDSLSPGKIARLLRNADAGDPIAYLELCEQIEERDPHYVGILGTRKRAVAQLDIVVDAASDSPEHVRHADMIRNWLQRDELQGELFDMLDAVGKGYSVTEIIWDTSSGSWEPARLEWRDPRWFLPDPRDGATLRLRTEAGPEELTPYKYIHTVIRAKSGLPIRSGIGRLAVWHHMFKTFTARDWAIFVQAYGKPIRLGKYDRDATEQEKDILFQAVSNIAGDLAAIIPKDMLLELLDNKSIAASTDMYQSRANWLDQQMSKAVLGQTATTDAIAGGHAVGKEHRQVQGDIERADAKAMAAVLNRDLSRPWINLEFGVQDKYPKIRIGREETTELSALVSAVERLVPLGLRVEASTMSDRLGLPDPDAGAVLLAQPRPSAAPAGANGVPTELDLETKAPPALHAATLAPEGDAIDRAVAEIIAEHGYEMIAPMIAGLDADLAHATSLDEVETVLARHMATIDTDRLAELLARACFAARISGEAQEPLS